MNTKIVQLVEAGDTEENSIQINDQVAPQSIPTDTGKQTELFYWKYSPIN